MGWKNVKEHYRIEHIVAFHEGKGICIGSGYVHDIIVIDPEKKTIREGMSVRGNKDLERYWQEIHADTDKLWALIEEPDTFERSIPVYTYEGGNVIEKQCEEFGWPNVTHDGAIMYKNMFFIDRNEAVAAAIRDAESEIEYLNEDIIRKENEVANQCTRLAQTRSNLEKLKSDGKIETA